MATTDDDDDDGTPWASTACPHLPYALQIVVHFCRLLGVSARNRLVFADEKTEVPRSHD